VSHGTSAPDQRMKWLGFDRRVQREGVIAAAVSDIVEAV
jgi:hypothetical protein